MLAKSRSRAIALAAVAMLLTAAAGSVQAAKVTKSLTATFCFAQRGGAPAGDGELFATVDWAGYRVNGVSIGVGDGSGQGLGFIEPVDPPSRQGRLTLSIGVNNTDFRVGGVDIRNGNHIWDSREVNAPNGDWSQLTACA